ncbi:MULTISPECIES: AMP-binding protein [Calothrix]|uniref:AMP-binding protein n=2 Tax=Calothrix TaxID=1186 RepID=A0ABR8A9J0_9CYAN|nr:MULTISPECIES: AMP-binding protein [Calothrix]MBD2195442.1 AMP-binding protein [Calothrix parietina FACHB-288]MBD2223104.1 AMP-binding protein [Calothrix anomala FACHB-343]
MQNLFSPYFPVLTKSTTIVDVLRQYAIQQPDKEAFIFLKHSINDRLPEETRLTYKELDQAARNIANILLRHNTDSNLPVLLVFPPGLAFIKAFFGCLYAGMIAVPANPPRRNQSLKRIKSIVADSGARIGLTSELLLNNLQVLGVDTLDISDIKALQWLVVDNLEVNNVYDVQEPIPLVKTESIAFLQYTSGSTGDPKAVMVSHSNLIHNEKMIQKAFGHSKETLFVGWLPLYHDMGLVGNVLQPLFLGITSILMSPVDFLQQPYCWLKAISDYKATTSGGPNFAYELCVRKVTPEQRLSLDLSSWELAFNGAEPIRAETLKAFTEAFAPCGFRRTAFYPCYGMAETTLLVSGGEKEDVPVVYSLDRDALRRGEALITQDHQGEQTTQLVVGCGHSWDEETIRIVNPETFVTCLDNQVGEIWVAGPNVAQGYWHRTEQTEKIFNAYIADTQEGPFLRTGDLGFLHDGELFVTGRIKDVIIIRGRNHYPQDIELTVEKSHPALKLGSSAAFSVEIKGEERLVIAQEVERNYLRKLDINEVATAIRRAVSQEHDLQLYAVVLLKTGSILKTSSGKIQRQACRNSFLNNTLIVVGLWKLEDELLENSALLTTSESNSVHTLENSQSDLTLQPIHSSSKYNLDSILSWIETWLAQKLKIDPHQIDPSQSFADFGIDSVMAVEFSQALGDWLEIPIEATILWKFSTIESLGKYLITELQFTKPSCAKTQSQPQQENLSAINHNSQIGIEALINQEISALEKLLEKDK